MYFGKVRRSQDKELMIMTKGIEIQTVHQNTRDYIKKYRDIPKFLQFCKACPRYITDVGLVRNMVLIRNNTLRLTLMFISSVPKYRCLHHCGK